ncbi:hypothetical protein Dsin_031536 [Dipteronia sinensis]|uniref:Uncharacterized protein n=1 Tax=Dipteronia sinensis TaxID=43782 RepID=A0AAE0DTG7_9ROSI|nr:hypothetical protein Dsin_031536 [Dipteronia sinensis]
MNGYSRMKIIGTTKSRSMDFSDLVSFPQSQKSTSKTTQNPKTKVQEPNNQIKKPATKQEEEEEEEKEEEEEEEEDHHHQQGNVGDNVNNKLSRTRSVSSASAMKRALSMRRSSSVSERYCRIHDQSLTFAASPIDDHEDQDVKKKKKKHSTSNKILKAYPSRNRLHPSMNR